MPSDALHTPYTAAPDRYDAMPYRRCGRSGLKLPAVSLGLWHNFGDDQPLETQRAILRRAFDLGHHPLRPGQQLRPAVRLRGVELRPAPARGLRARTATSWSSRPRRATTCGPARTASGARASTCWPASTSPCARMGLDYVDIFYSHRFDPDTPLEETMGALDTAVRSGQGAVRRHLVLLAGAHRARRRAILRDLGTPLLIHQPSYSMLNRWIERRPAATSWSEVGAGCIAFSPLAQGMLTDRYLDGIPEGSRAGRRASRSTPSAADRGEPEPRAGAQRDRRSGAGSRWPRWRSPGCCATSGSPRR